MHDLNMMKDLLMGAWNTQRFDVTCDTGRSLSFKETEKPS